MEWRVKIGCEGDTKLFEMAGCRYRGEVRVSLEMGGTLPFTNYGTNTRNCLKLSKTQLHLVS